VPWAVFVVLAARLYARVSALAVDLPFWDQWDFWNPFFWGSPPWTFFRWQHGPQWQGLGGLVLWASGHASGLSVRFEGFVSTTFVVVGAACFLAFARRVRGGLGPVDAVLPLILLSPLHADAIATTPNPAHGPVPFLLLCLAPSLVTMRRDAARLPLLVLLAASATSTGFTYLLVPPLLAIALLDLLRARGAARGAHAAALLGVALAGASFLPGFTPVSAVGCFQFPDPHPERYLAFAAGILGRPLGLLRPEVIPVAVAFVATAGVVAAAAWGARTLTRRPDDPAGRAAFLLCAFALLFAGSTAIGRVCLGLSASNGDRYVHYVVPALAAAFLAMRRPGGATLPALCAGALVLGSTAWHATHPARETLRYSEGKRRVLACLREGRRVEPCTTEAGFAIYPDPAATGLDGKVEHLRSRRLGPFKD
jgi:hypothetical protein